MSVWRRGRSLAVRRDLGREPGHLSRPPSASSTPKRRRPLPKRDPMAASAAIVGKARSSPRSRPRAFQPNGRRRRRARQLEIIRQNDSRSCAFGWFKTAERQRLRPLHQERSPGFTNDRALPLRPASNHHCRHYAGCSARRSRSRCRGQGSRAFVYGNALDGKLAAMKARRREYRQGVRRPDRNDPLTRPAA